MGTPRIRSVGTAVPDRRFDQETVVGLFGYTDPLRTRFFLNSGIEGRHLYLTAPDPRPESVDELAARFREGVLALGARAVAACLERADLRVTDIDFLATTTCTGRLCPSLDAHLIHDLGFRADVQRGFDIGRAGQSMMLAAAARGLGSCPIALHDRDRAREVLALPEGHEATWAIALGYPDEEAEVGQRRRAAAAGFTGRRPLADMVHRGRFGGPGD